MWFCMVLRSSAWFLIVPCGSLLFAWFAGFCMFSRGFAWSSMVLRDFARFRQVSQGLGCFCVVLLGSVWFCVVPHGFARFQEVLRGFVCVMKFDFFFFLQ